MTKRTEEIKNLFPTSDWNHCPTSVNPADLLTRGINAHSHSNHLYGNVGRCCYNLSHIGLLGLPLYTQVFETVVAFTEMIIYDTHGIQLHPGVCTTVTALHSNVWIPYIRQYTKKLLRRCVTYRRLEGNTFRALDSSPLPTLGVQEGIPFAVTEVDFAGPLYI